MSEEVLRTHCATLQAMLMSSAKQLHEAEMENARLKAEIEKLTLLQVETLNERNKAEAEVERLDNLVRFWSDKYQNENARFLRACERIKTNEGKPQS